MADNYRTSDKFRASRAKTAKRRYWADRERQIARFKIYRLRKKLLKGG